MPEKIDSFNGKYRFLSNYYRSPICHEGIVYPTVEHAFHAAKNPKQSYRQMIANVKTPGEAKWLGRYISLRKDWEQVKDEIMKDLLRLKFASPRLKRK
jgi:ribA/ribD-fused uncharacterized protein